MANDFRKFSLDLDDFARKVGFSAKTVQKRVAFELFDRIVRKTPVDTGRARASWTISEVQGVESVPARRTRVGAGVGPGLARRASKMAATKPQLAVQPNNRKSGAVTTVDQIWISNNVPYIVKLEEGHSKQAPQGMVAVSIEEVTLKMESLVREGLKDAGL